MTNEQIIAAIGAALQGLTQALIDKDAKNALKLEGKTLAEVKSEVLSGVDLTTVVLKTDDLGQYEVEVLFAGNAEPARMNLGSLLSQFSSDLETLTTWHTDPASTGDVLEGADTAKWVNVAGVKAAIDAAIDALVDGAPTALDTLKELADKLSEDGDALAALITQVDQKLDKTARAADSALLEGKTLAEVQGGESALPANVIPATLVATDGYVNGNYVGNVPAADYAFANPQIGDVATLRVRVSDVDELKLIERELTVVRGNGKLETFFQASTLNGRDFVTAAWNRLVVKGEQVNDSAALEGKSLLQVQSTDRFSVAAVTDASIAGNNPSLVWTVLGSAAGYQKRAWIKASDAGDVQALAIPGIEALYSDFANQYGLLTVYSLQGANDEGITKSRLVREFTIGNLTYRQTALYEDTVWGDWELVVGAPVADVDTSAYVDFNDHQALIDLNPMVIVDHANGHFVGQCDASQVTALGLPNGTAPGVLAVLIYDGVVGGQTARLAHRVFVESQGDDKLSRVFNQDVSYSGSGGPKISTWVKQVNDAEAFKTEIETSIRGGAALVVTLKTLGDDLAAFIAMKATAEQAIAGTDDQRYITAIGLKAAVDTAIAALVDGAPTALDTLKELADKLSEDGDALNALIVQVDGKLGRYDDVGANPLALSTDTTIETGFVHTVTAFGTTYQGGVGSYRSVKTGDDYSAEIDINGDGSEWYNAADMQLPDLVDTIVDRMISENAVDGTTYYLTIDSVQGGDVPVTKPPRALKAIVEDLLTKNTAQDQALSDAQSQIHQRITTEMQAEQQARIQSIEGVTTGYQGAISGVQNSIGAVSDALNNVFTQLDQRLDILEAGGTIEIDITTAPGNALLKAETREQMAAIVALGFGRYVARVPSSMAGDIAPAGLFDTGTENEAVMIVDVVHGDATDASIGAIIRRTFEFGNDIEMVDDGRHTGTWIQESLYRASGAVHVRSWEQGVTRDDLTQISDSIGQAIDDIRGGSTSEVTLKTISDGLAAFIAKKATGQEAIDGTDDEKYITALALKAKVDDAIIALVNGAPEALDTLKELADKLTDQDDAVAVIVQSLGEKLGKTETAADSSKFAGKTVAERTASAAEVIAGIDGEKWVTSADIKALLGDLNDKHGLFKVLDMTVGSGKEAMASAGPVAVYNVGVVHGRVRGNQVGLTGGLQGNSYGVLTIYGQSAGPLPSVGAPPGSATSGIRREFRNVNGTRWQTVNVTGSGTEGDPFVYSWSAWNVQAELTSTVAAASQVIVGSGLLSSNVYSDDPALVAAVLNNQAGFGVFTVSLVESGASASVSEYNWPGIEQAVPNVLARTGRMEVWWSGTILFRRIVLGGLIATQSATNVGNGGVFSAWERIGNGVADDANKLGGELPDFYASQASVDSMFESLTDSINAATDLVGGVTRLTFRLTPGDFGQQGGNGGTLYGYERNDRGTLAPDNIFHAQDEITELSWQTVDNKFALWVTGDYSDAIIEEFTIGGVTAAGTMQTTGQDDETSFVWTGTPDVSGIPTSGEVKVVLRVRFPQA